MHYFKRNIGDYHKKAGRLTMLEHGAYTLLLDACYDRERFPSEDEAIEWCWARTAEEIAAVKFVLSKFFTLSDGLYVQTRVAEEIDGYHEKAKKNREIAQAREEARKAKRAQVVNEPCTNGHLTINQEPLTINQEPDKSIGASGKPERAKSLKVSDLVALGVDKQHATDWMAIRKQQRAPLTQTALDAAMRESAAAGISLADAVKIAAERGWRGFKSEWLRNASQFSPISKHSGFDQRDYTEGLTQREDGSYEL